MKHTPTPRITVSIIHPAITNTTQTIDVPRDMALLLPRKLLTTGRHTLDPTTPVTLDTVIDLLNHDPYGFDATATPDGHLRITLPADGIYTLDQACCMDWLLRAPTISEWGPEDDAMVELGSPRQAGHDNDRIPAMEQASVFIPASNVAWFNQLFRKLRLPSILDAKAVGSVAMGELLATEYKCQDIWITVDGITINQPHTTTRARITIYLLAVLKSVVLFTPK